MASEQFIIMETGSKHIQAAPDRADNVSVITTVNYYNTSTVRAPVFGRHQFFGTSEHSEKPMEVYYLDE